MSAKSLNSPRFIKLEISAINLEASIDEFEELQHERIVRILLTHDNEYLGVTDYAFYFIEDIGGTYRYLMRASLRHLLDNQIIGDRRLCREIVNQIKKLDDRTKAFVIASLTAESLPSYFFNINKEFNTIREFLEEIGRYAEENEFLIECECRPYKPSPKEKNAYFYFFRNFIDNLEFTKCRYGYGITDTGDPCIRIGKHGFIYPARPKIVAPM